ncbi:MAG: hypothetical protein N5P05_003157 [Chroococcopsis gigantea SAG 12.99]|jgi:hypothetical protein|nr:hypothetical protein [Chlorogloea purpurea SAG 13.99]MDV3001551.1 hypothetical protein [Chroococcopsis gigantea SAG 12.99]
MSSKYLKILPLAMILALGIMDHAQAAPNNNTKDKPAPSQPTSGSENPAGDNNDLRPLTQADSLLSFQGAQKLMGEASQAINSGNYEVATEKLQQARRIFNQLSNYHLQLANSFSGIDPKVFDSQRTSALSTGQMRDEATYQLALVHRAQNKPELAVPLLIQVIQSQNPSSVLGQKSYQQLYELGFVSTPYATSSPGSTPAPAPTSNAPTPK